MYFYNLKGNPNLCQSNPCPVKVTVLPTKKKSTHVASIIAGISMVIVLLAAFAVFWIIKRKRDHGNSFVWFSILKNMYVVQVFFSGVGPGFNLWEKEYIQD